MKIKVLVCSADGSQRIEERDVADDYLTPEKTEMEEQTPQQ